MGFLDKLKKSAGGAGGAAGLASKAADAVADNADKVDDGIDKIADVVDDKTKGKHTDKIDKAATQAKGLVDKAEERSTKKGGGGSF